MDKRTSSTPAGQNKDHQASLDEFKSYIQKVGRKELGLVQKKLNFLCLEFDPYQDDELSDEEKNIIEEFELSGLLGNPFAFTNVVLQMMDALEGEIKSRSH